MQYQNEQTIAVMVKTIQQAINAISHELDKPSVPNVPEVVTGSFVQKKPSLKFTKTEKELYDLLAVRKHGININTICKELNISQYTFRNRLYRLRLRLYPAGMTVSTEYVGSRRPKYRLAMGE